MFSTNLRSNKWSAPPFSTAFSLHSFQYNDTFEEFIHGWILSYAWDKQWFASTGVALKRWDWHVCQMFLGPWLLPLCSPSLYTRSVTQKHALHTLTASKSLHPTCHWRFELLQVIWSDCRWFFRQMPLVFLAHTLTLLPSQEITSTTQLTVLLF